MKNIQQFNPVERYIIKNRSMFNNHHKRGWKETLRNPLQAEKTEASFQTVPFVRFRKSLTSRGISEAHSFEEAYRLTERTDFIVNAESFHAFLKQWQFYR